MADLKLRTISLATSILGVSRVYTINGFDVSEGVGVVDWEKVRYNTKYNFASFRYCLGKNPDAQVENNVAGVNSIEGYPWYPYFVPKFGNWEGETDYFLSMWDKYGGSPMPPEIDVEYRYHPPEMTKGDMLRWITKSYDKIKARTGFSRLFLYSNKAYWDTHVETDDYLRREALKEVAQWNSWIDEPDLIPDNWSVWEVWQDWHKTKEDFAVGNIDHKRFYGVHSDFVAIFGINPYYAEIVTPPPPPTGDALYMIVLQDGLRIRSKPRGTIIGSLSAGEILRVDNVGGADSWIQHEKGWSNVQDGIDVNMEKYNG